MEDRYVIADSTMTDADVDGPDGRHGFIQKKRLRWWDAGMTVLECWFMNAKVKKKTNLKEYTCYCD